MSQEIKLRAWDSINNVMVYNFESFSKKQIHTEKGSYSWTINVVKNNQLRASVCFREKGSAELNRVAKMPLMQAMDQLDDNQQRIYHKDIVLADLNWKGGRVGKEVFEIEYVNGCFYMHSWSGYDIAEALKSGEIKSLKVIGNTYENADLLIHER